MVPLRISLTVNGASQSHDVEPRLLLVHYLRDVVGLTGTNVGCDTSSCGACTIHVDGESVKSCTMLAVQADGTDIMTIEGLANGDQLHPMQDAFRENHGLQCGYCTPGMVMAAVGLLNENPKPTEAEVREGLEGNLCRCTGYHNIVKAVLAASGRGGERMTAVETAPAGVVGTRMLRKEDPALLTGEAKYTDDLAIPGALSPRRACAAPTPTPASAASTPSAALGMPGVVAVYTGADLRDLWAARCRARGP